MEGHDMTDTHTTSITRRRVLFIGGTLLGGALASTAIASELSVVRWKGQALGAHAQMELVGVDPQKAKAIFRDVEAEIARLEAIFSLYRTDSSLMRLNREGRLTNPPPELLEILTLSSTMHEQTFGLFDPTVQPLFAFYASYFSGGQNAGKTPDARTTHEVVARVGFDKVRFDARSVSFAKKGMALTLNGIAQGYITDRIGDLLRQQGFANLLLDIGEISAIGAGRDGQGWRVGIRRSVEDETVSTRLRVSDRAVATSMMFGTTFDEGRKAGHILHPRVGLVQASNANATVVDRRAARADALSTAAILMGNEELSALKSSGVEIYI
jgi:FAD:protein FMN transferase